MAARRGSCTAVSSSASAPAQHPNNRSKCGASTKLLTVPYRPLRSPLDDSLALWNEGRRERIGELEAEFRQNDARRREGGNLSQAAGGTHPPHQPRPCAENAPSDGRAHDVLGSSPPTVVGSVETRDRGDRFELPAYGTGLSSVACDLELSLDRRLSLWERGWRPPPLRELPRGGEGFFSGWTYFGQPERFELVKSTNRSLGPQGAALTDAELEWAVLSLEDAEERMASLQFSEAANVLENVLVRCPGLTLAYYRLALCLLAARGAHASNQVTRLLDCAVFLEGAENPHLRAAVDLVMRMLRNDAIPEESWSEDHPKSLGDLRALEAALDQLI